MVEGDLQSTYVATVEREGQEKLVCLHDSNDRVTVRSASPSSVRLSASAFGRSLQVTQQWCLSFLCSLASLELIRWDAESHCLPLAIA